MQIEEAAVEIARLVESKSKFQDQIGQLVIDVQETYGTHQTDSLQELVKEQGVTISSNSLRQYAWVLKNSKDLNLPEDLDFSTRRSIINSPLKEKYLSLIAKGYTGAQIKREIAQDNKTAKSKTTGFCSVCHKQVDVKKHACLQEH